MEADGSLTRIAELSHKQLDGHVQVVYNPFCRHAYECHRKPSELRITITIAGIETPEDIEWFKRAILSALRIRRGLSLADSIHGKLLDEDEEKEMVQ